MMQRRSSGSSTLPFAITSKYGVAIVTSRRWRFCQSALSLASMLSCKQDSFQCPSTKGKGEKE
jgi:hypothetical protein